MVLLSDMFSTFVCQSSLGVGGGCTITNLNVVPTQAQLVVKAFLLTDPGVTGIGERPAHRPWRRGRQAAPDGCVPQEAGDRVQIMGS